MTVWGLLALINVIMLLPSGLIFIFCSDNYPGNTDGDKELGIGMVIISIILLLLIFL